MPRLCEVDKHTGRQVLWCTREQQGEKQCAKIAVRKNSELHGQTRSVGLDAPLRLPPLPLPLLVAQEAPAAENAGCHGRNPVHKDVLRHGLGGVQISKCKGEGCRGGRAQGSQGVGSWEWLRRPRTRRPVSLQDRAPSQARQGQAGRQGLRHGLETAAARAGSGHAPLLREGPLTCSPALTATTVASSGTHSFSVLRQEGKDNKLAG